jgi:hypothetical protein
MTTNRKSTATAHRQKLGPRQEKQAGGVDEGEDQIEHRMHGIARGDDHEGRSNRDEREEVEEHRFNAVQHVNPVISPARNLAGHEPVEGPAACS